MPIANLMQTLGPWDLMAYDPDVDRENLARHHVAYTGAARKFGREERKLLLITDPFSSNTSYLEFMAVDISLVEEAGNIVDPDGEVIPLVRVWVRKGSIGVRSTPFVVEDTGNARTYR